MRILKIVVFALLTIFFSYLYITHGNNGVNYKKEKAQLELDTKLLQKQTDSLNMANINLQNQYNKLQEKSTQDSTISDSLKNEYNYLYNNTNKSNKKANLYLDKLSDDNRKIFLFENSKNYKKGDELLNSLSKKIN